MGRNPTKERQRNPQKKVERSILEIANREREMGQEREGEGERLRQSQVARVNGGVKDLRYYTDEERGKDRDPEPKVKGTETQKVETEEKGEEKLRKRGRK